MKRMTKSRAASLWHKISTGRADQLLEEWGIEQDVTLLDPVGCKKVADFLRRIANGLSSMGKK